VVDTLEGRDAIQRDLDRLERWACESLMNFKNPNCMVLHMGQDNSKHKYRLGREWIESIHEEDLGVLVDKKINKSWQCALAAQKASLFWAASRRAWPSGQGRLFCPSTPL